MNDITPLTNFLPGDILLVRNPGLTGLANLAYQRMRRLFSQRRLILGFVPTHVALVLGRDDIIHSDRRPIPPEMKHEPVESRKKTDFAIASFRPKTWLKSAISRRVFGYGVERAHMADVLHGMKPGDVMVVRHPDLPTSGNVEFAVELARAAMHYLDMPYNMRIDLLRGDAESTYCSQYIYQVFNAVGLKLPEHSPDRVLPIDFLIWATDQKWQTFDGAQTLQLWREHQNYSQTMLSWPAIMSRHHRQMVALDKSALTLHATLARMGEENVERARNWGVRPTRPTVAFIRDRVAMPEIPAFVCSGADLLDRAYTEKLGGGGEDRRATTSWTIDEKARADVEARQKATQERNALLLLGTTTLALDDLADALKEAIAHLATTPMATSSDIQLRRLAFVLDCFRLSEGEDRLEERATTLGTRQQEIREMIDGKAKELAGLRAPYDGLEAKKIIHDFGLMLLMFHGYAIARDSIEMFRVLGTVAPNPEPDWKELFARLKADELLSQIEALRQKLPHSRGISEQMLKDYGLDKVFAA